MEEAVPALLQMVGRWLARERQALSGQAGERHALGRLAFQGAYAAVALSTVRHQLVVAAAEHTDGFSIEYVTDVIRAELRGRPAEEQPFFALTNPVAIPAFLARDGLGAQERAAVTWLSVLLLTVSPEQACLFRFNFSEEITVSMEALARQLPYFTVALADQPLFELGVNNRLITPWPEHSLDCFWNAVYPLPVAARLAELSPGSRPAQHEASGVDPRRE